MRSVYETSVVQELRVNDVVECSENSEQFNNRRTMTVVKKNFRYCFKKNRGLQYISIGLSTQYRVCNFS